MRTDWTAAALCIVTHRAKLDASKRDPPLTQTLLHEERGPFRFEAHGHSRTEHHRRHKDAERAGDPDVERLLEILTLAPPARGKEQSFAVWIGVGRIRQPLPQGDELSQATNLGVGCKSYVYDVERRSPRHRAIEIRHDDQIDSAPFRAKFLVNKA
jgi:hypothetical protein